MMRLPSSCTRGDFGLASRADLREQETVSQRLKLRATVLSLGNRTRNALIAIGISVVLFIALNFIAYLAMPHFVHSPSQDVFDVVSWPHSSVGQKVLKGVFDTEDWGQAIRYNDASPNFASHPTLSFITEPVRNNHFSMGPEGIRLEPGWDDDFARRLLQSNNHLIFLLGGSTVLGHGVGANHTVSFFLNEALRDSGVITLNLGSEAYDQHRDIEKLVYLLRAGFRPERVIFLEGWNDILGMARSNLRAQDKLTYHGFATNRGEIAFTPGDRVDDRRHVRLFLESLPAYRLLETYKRLPISVDRMPAERDAFTQGFDFYEAEFVFLHWADFADRHRDLLKKQIIDSFETNLAFLQALSIGFNFRVSSFYQPIGLLDLDNPFVGNQARAARGYDYVVEMDRVIRDAIASGRLPMIDISKALRDLPNHKYIDVAHYSPAANKALAHTMLRHMLGASTMSGQ
jgi:hypothetical protein